MVQKLAVPANEKPFQRQSRWRSNGWSPLAYPCSAVMLDDGADEAAVVETTGADTSNSSRNRFFPLHVDVLRACLRELLIMDGTIDGHTLLLQEGGAILRKHDSNAVGREVVTAPRFLCHVEPQRWLRSENNSSNEQDQHCANAPSPRKSGKRKQTISSEKKSPRPAKKPRTTAMNVAKKTLKANERGSTSQSEATITIDSTVLSDFPVTSGEALTDLLLSRSVTHPQPANRKPAAAVGKPPRKVSDADKDHYTTDTTATTNGQDCGGDAKVKGGFEEIQGGEDISAYVSLGDEVKLLRSELPSLLKVSIVTETKLRDRAFSITKKLSASFQEECLRLFLGYRSCSLKRNRLVRLLSDYLFDVSHAMFAWQQTEAEIMGSTSLKKSRGSVGYYNRVDALVRDALFDQRALKKIGGWDDTSTLRHAVYMSRCVNNNETWEMFAKTVPGRRLLSHHRTGRAFLAGQKRRGQRVKHRSKIISGKAVKPALVKDDDASDAESKMSEQEKLELPEVHHVSLARKSGDSWGILLAREGNLCVVDRAPSMFGRKKPQIRCGDIILSVMNECGQHAGPPSSFTGGPQSAWFRDVVRLFKTSNRLRLQIRRVGS